MKKIVCFFVFSSLFLNTMISKAADAFVVSNLNFRAGPGTQHALRGLIPAGKLVFVQTCEGNWCHIRYNAQTGWVSSRYLAFKEGNDLYHTYAIFSGTNRNMYGFNIRNRHNEHFYGINESSCYHTKNIKRNSSEN
ncbi:SH3 domain-containing protein [Bartonella sp. 220]|uniref:SH3 domain-containing protein n=1 Tax=Bartonella sp. 220B TaxID=2967260 RepID=UPI0022A94809|nr:SH3 domain-containing protein [Bartonella sp. 220B]MCZ2158362.1 SH3 domain-containing protein [Bartonella sp. 220B]